jgi:hypothetical protein
MTITEASQLTTEQIARHFHVPVDLLQGAPRVAAPRTWSLCMTSENHGTVGPAGCKFSHASEKHERVSVVEVPTAAGVPVDQVNLQLVASAGRQADVDRALRTAQTWANEEYMCGRRMGKSELAMSDRADAAKTECTTAILALAAPVAVQAGQVAVPTDEVIVTALHACAIDTRPSKYGFTELQVDATNVPGIRAVYMKIAAAMQASTSGERQEGGSRG